MSHPILSRTENGVDVVSGARRLEALLVTQGQATALLDGEQVTITRNADGDLTILPNAANDPRVV